MTFMNAHDSRKLCFLMICHISLSLIVSNIQAEEVNNWISQGNKYLNEKSYKEAFSCFNRAIKEDPNNSTVWHQRGAVLYEMGQPTEALDSFRRVLEIDPNSVSTYRYQASIFQKLGRFQEADASLQRADKIAGQWQTKVQNLLDSGNYQRALFYCDMLLYHTTFEDWAWNMKGLCFLNAGSYDDALFCFDQSLEKGHANDYIVLFNKAECLLALQRYKEAIDWYEKALQIKPDYVLALQRKADALEAIGNQIEADSVRKKLRDIQRWDSLKEKLRKYTLRTTIVALLLGCICLLISFLAGPSWITRAGIAAILLAVCGGVLWLNFRFTWLPFILAFGITALITVLWYRWWDEGNVERAKRIAERAERKKQIHLNEDIEKISSAVKKQIDSQKPLENILLNIHIKNPEAVAKAISTIDSLKDTEKGCLFNNMDIDFISHTLHYMKDSEKTAILQQLEPRKREDVLMRFPLHKRSHLRDALE